MCMLIAHIFHEVDDAEAVGPGLALVTADALRDDVLTLLVQRLSKQLHRVVDQQRLDLAFNIPHK